MRHPEVLPGDEIGVLAYGMAMVQVGRAWPSNTQVSVHMDWTSRRAGESSLRLLQADGYITKDDGRRTWRPTRKAFEWALDNAGAIRAARRRESAPA